MLNCLFGIFLNKMNFDELFKIRTLVEIFVFLFVSKITLWLLRYLYRVWIYSSIPGPFNIPFLGNIFDLLKDRSGKFVVLL